MTSAQTLEENRILEAEKGLGEGEVSRLFGWLAFTTVAWADRLARSSANVFRV